MRSTLILVLALAFGTLTAYGDSGIERSAMGGQIALRGRVTGSLLKLTAEAEYLATNHAPRCMTTTFDGDYDAATQYRETVAATDGQGNYHVEIPLKNHLDGDPQDVCKARLWRLSIEVFDQDLASHAGVLPDASWDMENTNVVAAGGSDNVDLSRLTLVSLKPRFVNSAGQVPWWTLDESFNGNLPDWTTYLFSATDDETLTYSIDYEVTKP